VSTHWAWPTSATTSSWRKAANSAARLAPQEGQSSLPLYEKGEQVLGGAVGAADAGEASLEDAAVEVPRDHAVEEASPEAVAALEEILPDPLDGLEQGLEQRVERGLGRPAGPVDGGIHERETWQPSCRGRDLDASTCGRMSMVGGIPLPFMANVRSVFIHTLAVTLGLVVMCAGCTRTSGRSVSLLGSTSIQPFAEMLAERYAKDFPGQFVEVQGGGSTAGLQAAENGLADIGMCSRSLTAKEALLFIPILIARDGLAIVVNRDNSVAKLSIEQLRAVFAGRVTNWSEVGGKSGPIRPITREEGSGTRESFVRLVMDKERISGRALTQESNGAVKELVKGDPAAIGYMSLGLVGKDLKAVAVEGTQPTALNVLAGRYNLVRPLLFVTKGAVNPAAQKFIDFVLSPVGQSLLVTEGLVRAR